MIVYFFIFFFILIISYLIYLYIKPNKSLSKTVDPPITVVSELSMATPELSMATPEINTIIVAQKPSTPVVQNPSKTDTPIPYITDVPISPIIAAPTKNPLQIQKRICDTHPIPPCNKGFISQQVQDPDKPDPDFTVACCLIDPTKENASELNAAIDLTLQIGTTIAVGGAFEVSSHIAAGLMKKGPTKFAQSVFSKMALKLGPKIGEKIAIRVGEKVGVKVATKVGISIGARFLAHMAMGPVGWAMLAFDLLTAGLDLADPGGYANSHFLSEFIESRDETNKYYDNYLIKQGITPPAIVGPLLSLPQKLSTDDPKSYIFNDNPILSQTQLALYVMSEYASEYLDKFLHQVTDKYTLSETELLTIVDTLNTQALSFFDTPGGATYLNERGCIVLKGVNIKGQCGFPDQSTCENSFNWGHIKSDLGGADPASGDTYVEWRNNQCIIVAPTLRSGCEDAGLPYDKTRQVCTLSKAYCLEKGLEPVTNNDGSQDCKLNDGQNIAEMIFGTTVTRGLIQVFDIRQYKPCSKGDFDFNNVPETLKPILMINPLYSTIGNKLCVANTGCYKNEVIDNTLCYKSCKQGFKSDGATMCYKQYPDFEKNGELHTITQITKKLVMKPPSELSECPNGKQESLKLCYNKCRDGFKRVMLTCSRSGEPYTIRGPYACRYDCNNNKHICAPSWLGGKCTDTCLGYGGCSCDNNDPNTAGFCVPRCKDGYDNVLGICVPNTYTDANNAGVSMVCAKGKQQSGAFCYDQCASGYTMKTSGICAQDCPSGSTDYGVGCTREAYNRGTGHLPFTVYMKQRLIPYGKSSGPSPAEQLGKSIVK